MTAVLTRLALTDPALADPARAEPSPLAPSRPTLRLVPAPTSAPPFDDELPESTEPAVLHLVPRLAARLTPSPMPAAFDDDAWLAAERTPTAQPPPAGVFARTLLQAVLEVLAGVRPIAQLRRDTTPELYLRLRTTMRCRPRTQGLRPDRRAVRSVHVQERPEGIAEACATVHRGQRIAALALRIEGVDGRWQCTDLVGL